MYSRCKHETSLSQLLADPAQIIPVVVGNRNVCCFSHEQLGEAAWVDAATRCAPFLRVGLVGKHGDQRGEKKVWGTMRQAKKAKFSIGRQDAKLV
jgi:hypothetical protein